MTSLSISMLIALKFISLNCTSPYSSCTHIQLPTWHLQVYISLSSNINLSKQLLIFLLSLSTPSLLFFISVSNIFLASHSINIRVNFDHCFLLFSQHLIHFRNFKVLSPKISHIFPWSPPQSKPTLLLTWTNKKLSCSLSSNFALLLLPQSILYRSPE